MSYYLAVKHCNYSCKIKIIDGYHFYLISSDFFSIVEREKVCERERERVDVSDASNISCLYFGESFRK